MHSSRVESDSFYGWVSICVIVHFVMLRICVLFCFWLECGLFGVSPLDLVPVFSSVVCLYLVVFNDGFWWGMTQGVGNYMLMRGGACATELYLMMGWVCGIAAKGCGLLFVVCESVSCVFLVVGCSSCLWWYKFVWYRGWFHNFCWIGFP